MNSKLLIIEKIKGKTYAQIARENNISRQRVQQIISPDKKVRLEILKKYNYCCAECGLYVGDSGHVHHKENNRNYNNIHNLYLLCQPCHRRAHAKEKIVIKKKIVPKIMLICTNCGLKFTSSDIKSRIRRNHSGNFYCSRYCQGKWLATTAGWGSRNNVKINSKKLLIFLKRVVS